MSKKQEEKFTFKGDIDKAINEKRAIEVLIRKREAKKWMEEMTNESIPGGEVDFVQNLRDGVYLCYLCNAFTKNSIKKIHSVKSGNVFEFMAIENLNNSFKACRTIDFPDYHNFTIPDIWEGKNLYKVVQFLHALAHFLGKKNLGFPKIRDLSKEKHTFSQDDIHKQMNELPDDFKPIAPPGSDDVKDEEPDEDNLELASPNECSLDGEGTKTAEAGVEATFTIIAKDELGNELDHGDETFEVVIRKKDDKKTKLTATVKDNKK